MAGCDIIVKSAGLAEGSCFTASTVFVAQRGFDVPKLSDAARLSDLAFLVDISKHINVLNINLQG